MNFTDLFIRRPVLAIVVNLVIIVAGIQAYRTLTVRQYPRSEIATITVSTVYTGANAELVRGFITTPLERVIAAADGIDYLESTSSQGMSSIVAHLKINYDSTKALAEISSKVDQVRRDLPTEAEVPVLNITNVDSQFASAYLSFTSDTLRDNEITDYLTRVVQPRLSSLGGVQRADILGGRVFAMRVWLNPEKMAALNVTATQVRAALGANNYLSALGRTKGSWTQENLVANTDLRSVDEFKRLVVRSEGGATVRLEDIATVVLGAEDYETEVRFSGQNAVFMGVWVLPNANTLDVIRSVHDVLPDIQRNLPSGLEAHVAYDSTRYINDSIHEVYSTLTDTLIIVVAVIYLFLGSFRSVLIPVIAIPVSLIGAIFLMQVFGFTINLLTLLSVVLSVGLVVDDAIVVVENVERHLREGLKPFDAAIRGARELVGPIIAMTITLAAVYAPIGLQGGLTGALFREFAFTLAGAVLISGIVALTLSPVMCANILSHKLESGRFTSMIERHFNRFRNFYARSLDAVLAQRWAVYIVWAVLTVLVVPLFMFSARELAPSEDQGIIFAQAEGAANSTLDQTALFTRQAFRDAIKSTPEYDYAFQITYAGGGIMGLVTKPWSERERKIFKILPEVTQKYAQIPGVRVNAGLPAALPGGGGIFPAEIVIASTASEQELLGFAQQLAMETYKDGLWPFPPLIDLKIDQPQSQLVLDRDKVASLGLNLAQVGADIGSMIGGGYVNRFSIAGRSYKVIPQIERTGRLNADQLEDIYVSGPNDQLIPVSTFATIKNTVEPRQLARFNQMNAVTLSCFPKGDLGGILDKFEKRAKEILPKGYIVDFKGQSRQLKVEGNKFLPSMLLALILIFLVLAAQFNSFRDPFVILLGSVPLAMFGALLFTFLKMMNPNIAWWTDGWTTSLNIYSQIGLITLVGLIAKNGILIVEFANHQQEAGLSKLEAIKAGAGLRLRAIMMTTAATVFGHLPLCFVSGPGAAARNSIGLVLCTGLTIGTFFTLFVVPCLYMLLAKDHKAQKAKVELQFAGTDSHAPAHAK
ncbi:MAG: efflux RND transporter permease subunit [Opitutaceae bacterium]